MRSIETCEARPKREICKSQVLKQPRRSRGGAEEEPGRSRGGAKEAEGAGPPLRFNFYIHVTCHSRIPFLSLTIHRYKSYGLNIKLPGIILFIRLSFSYFSGV